MSVFFLLLCVVMHIVHLTRVARSTHSTPPNAATGHHLGDERRKTWLNLFFFFFTRLLISLARRLHSNHLFIFQFILNSIPKHHLIYRDKKWFTVNWMSRASSLLNTNKQQIECGRAERTHASSSTKWMHIKFHDFLCSSVVLSVCVWLSAGIERSTWKTIRIDWRKPEHSDDDSKKKLNNVKHKKVSHIGPSQSRTPLTAHESRSHISVHGLRLRHSRSNKTGLIAAYARRWCLHESMRDGNML